MIAQKYWDDTPLRNIDFSVAWGRVCPHEKPAAARKHPTELPRRAPRDGHTPSPRPTGVKSVSTALPRRAPRDGHKRLGTRRPVPIDRVNAMECIFLGALGFDLYVPEAKYNACADPCGNQSSEVRFLRRGECFDDAAVRRLQALSG